MPFSGLVDLIRFRIAVLSALNTLTHEIRMTRKHIGKDLQSVYDLVMKVVVDIESIKTRLHNASKDSGVTATDAKTMADELHQAHTELTDIASGKDSTTEEKDKETTPEPQKEPDPFSE